MERTKKSHPDMFGIMTTPPPPPPLPLPGAGTSAAEVAEEEEEGGEEEEDAVTRAGHVSLLEWCKQSPARKEDALKEAPRRTEGDGDGDGGPASPLPPAAPSAPGTPPPSAPGTPPPPPASAGLLSGRRRVFGDEGPFWPPYEMPPAEEARLERAYRSKQLLF